MKGKPYLQHRIEIITPEDTSGIAEHLREYRYPTGDFLKAGFAPTNGCVWDFTIVKDEGRYHLIHIDGRMDASCYAPGNLIYFGHSSTTDFVTWTTHDPALHSSPGAWDSGHVWAPYVFRDPKLGCWVMLYTGLNRYDCQQIGVAYSDDLMTWVKEPANPVFRPTYVDWIKYSLATGAACRDPHIRIEGDEYVLYTSIICQDGRVGIMGSASPDLVEWSSPWPVYLTDRASSVPREVESSAVHKERDRWLLFYTHGEGTHVVAGDNPRDFTGGTPTLIWPSIAAVEVVAKTDDLWLVSGYRLAGHAGSFKLFLGILNLESLKIAEVTDPAELTPYL